MLRGTSLPLPMPTAVHSAGANSSLAKVSSVRRGLSFALRDNFQTVVDDSPACLIGDNHLLIHLVSRADAMADDARRQCQGVSHAGLAHSHCFEARGVKALCPGSCGKRS
jgi:hypothetical protein